mgnify:CR=1 FL=1
MATTLMITSSFLVGLSSLQIVLNQGVTYLHLYSFPSRIVKAMLHLHESHKDKERCFVKGQVGVHVASVMFGRVSAIIDMICN